MTSSKKKQVFERYLSNLDSKKKVYDQKYILYSIDGIYVGIYILKVILLIVMIQLLCVITFNDINIIII